MGITSDALFFQKNERLSAHTSLSAFLAIGKELTTEHDREKLLSKLLDSAIDFANCDAGTLYLLDEDGLNFTRMVTKSQGIRQGGHAVPITLPPVPMNERFAAAYCAINNETINVPDIRKTKRFDFDGAYRYDEVTGYMTRSMLVVPMCNEKGAVIGVLQLINALDNKGRTIAFGSELEPYVGAIASQVSISITNMQYAKQIDDLVSSLARAIAMSIDSRSPYRSGHTRNMVRCAENFLGWLDRTKNAWRFTDERRKELLLSIWLHNIGELTVPVSILSKDTRLDEESLHNIEARFEHIHLLGKIDMLEGRISSEKYEEQERELANMREFINTVNTVAEPGEDVFKQIDAIEKLTYVDEDGNIQRWISAEEIECLRTKDGILTAAEQKVMGHDAPDATANILANVKFPEEYSHVACWASKQHEILEENSNIEQAGCSDIPKEARLIAILDTFATLTSLKCPYRDEPMPPEDAVKALRIMAEKDATIDKHILTLFSNSRAWEN